VTVLRMKTCCFVDLQTFLNKSDFLNHKYHVKRAIYLAYLAKKLSGKFKEQISFGLDGGNPLRPVLEIQEKEFRVQISAVPPPDFFKVQRFTQEKNNLRYHHFFGKSLPEDG
jgi:U3 small nucleolar RNA-associated protein 22